LLGTEFDLFKAMSPKDLYWETIGPQRHFYGDYEALIRSANQPIRSVHLNALHWKDDITQLAGQVDYLWCTSRRSPRACCGRCTTSSTLAGRR
jgi:hypothetical protein